MLLGQLNPPNDRPVCEIAKFEELKLKVAMTSSLAFPRVKEDVRQMNSGAKHLHSANRANANLPRGRNSVQDKVS